MPFFNDIGVRDEKRGPIGSAFAALADQLERLVVVNVAWAVQLIPGILALAFPELPPAVRLPLLLYSATVVIPATALLFGLCAAAAEREHLSLELAQRTWRRLGLASVRTLAPLYGSFGALVWGYILIGPGRVYALDVLVPFAGLSLLLLSTFWGPIFARHPEAPATEIARESLRIVWRRPADALLLAVAQVVAVIVGAISIGGLFLVAPVTIALLQTCGYQQSVGRRGEGAWR